MAFTPFGTGKLDKLLNSIFDKGVYYVGAKTQFEWDMIQKFKVNDPLARNYIFRIITDAGYSAAGAGRSPGTKYAFPKGQTAFIPEFTANYKLKATTISLSYDLYKQAALAGTAKALEPLASEITLKAMAEARIMACEFWLDGTGVRGTAASVSDAQIATGTVVVTLADSDNTRGHADCFEFGDIFIVKSVTGTAVNPTGAGGAFYGYKMVDKDTDLQTVTLQLVDTSFNAITTASASNIVATNVFYRVQGQETYANLTSNATVGDYGSATEIMPGLETLASADGRSVFGMQTTGILQGSQTDAGGSPLDPILVDQVLSKAVNRQGKGRFNYKQMIMDQYAHRQFVDNHDTDRRFNSYQDNTRGISYFGYAFRDMVLRTVISEYVRRRVWFLPETSSGEKVLEYHGTKWEDISVPGGAQTLLGFDSTAGQYTNEMNRFKQQRGILVCRNPAAIASLKNFTISI